MSQAERYAAILTFAYPGRVRRVTVDDLAALSEIADEDSITLACLLRRRMR